MRKPFKDHSKYEYECPCCKSKHLKQEMKKLKRRPDYGPKRYYQPVKVFGPRKELGLKVRKEIAEALNTLPRRDAEAIVLRLGLGKYEPMTFKEIGAFIGRADGVDRPLSSTTATNLYQCGIQGLSWDKIYYRYLEALEEDPSLSEPEKKLMTIVGRSISTDSRQRKKRVVELEAYWDSQRSGELPGITG